MPQLDTPSQSISPVGVPDGQQFTIRNPFGVSTRVEWRSGVLYVVDGLGDGSTGLTRREAKYFEQAELEVVRG